MNIPFESFSMICTEGFYMKMVKVNGIRFLIDGHLLISEIIRVCKAIKAYNNQTKVEAESIPLADLLNNVGEYEKSYYLEALPIIIDKAFGLVVDEEGNIILPPQGVDVIYELTEILRKNGKPMSLKELYAALIEKRPEIKDKSFDNIRSKVLEADALKPIGMTTRYALAEWDHVYRGTIRQLVADVLEEAKRPVHIDKIMKKVLKVYPNTNKKNVMASINSYKARFICFGDGLFGLMESHHYGYTPNFIAEIAKAAFTREFGEKEVEGTLRGIAARDFGFANAEQVLAVWKDWSESFAWHSARDYDQSGPLRLGSSYPFTLPGVKFPPPPPPRKNWMYLRNSYMGAQDQLAPQIATDEKELALLRSGNARMERILSRVPDGKRKAAKRMLGLGKYMEATVRTLRNARKYRLEGLKGSSASKEALLAILDDEEKNVRGLIPWVENDSSLGFEPSMRYVTDPKMLQWKLKQLEDERAVLQNAGATFSARKRVRSNPRLRPSPSLASPISHPSLLQSNPHNIERKTKHG